MFKTLISLFFLFFVVAATSACFSRIEKSPDIVVPTSPPGPLDIGASGIWYYEDGAKAAGYDPVFAVYGGNVFMLSQNDNGWDIHPITLDELRTYPFLISGGQTSDFGFYKYFPESGTITVKDQVLVKQPAREYNPEHYFWAWTSLVFIKGSRLHIYYINPSNETEVSDCHLDFVDASVTSCDEGFVFVK